MLSDNRVNIKFVQNSTQRTLLICLSFQSILLVFFACLKTFGFILLVLFYVLLSSVFLAFTSLLLG